MNTLPKTKEFKHSIIEKYFNMIYKLAVSQTKDIESAEDVTNDVFLKYMESHKDFENEEHIKAWLIRVTINGSRSLFSSSWFKKTVPLEDNIPVEMPEEESEVYGAVLKLPQKYRAVIHLFYYEDMKTAEIAMALGEKETTVRSQLSRAREMLKDILKGEDIIV